MELTAVAGSLGRHLAFYALPAEALTSWVCWIFEFFLKCFLSFIELFGVPWTAFKKLLVEQLAASLFHFPVALLYLFLHLFDPLSDRSSLAMRVTSKVFLFSPFKASAFKLVHRLPHLSILPMVSAEIFQATETYPYSN